MGKIFIKCKDKSAQRWLPAQKIQVVGNVPQQVEETIEVSRLLKKGVFVKTDANEYARHHNKSKLDNAKKLDLSMKLFSNAITEKDVVEAEKHLKSAKSNGLDSSKVERLEFQLEKLKTVVKADEDLKEKRDKATELVSEGINLGVFALDSRKFYTLGRKKLGKNSEEIVAWAVKNDENIAEIQKAIDAKKIK